MTWIIDNLPSVIVAVLVLATLSFVVVGMIKGKKHGKSSCGCGCSQCPMNGKCHEKGRNSKK